MEARSREAISSQEGGAHSSGALAGDDDELIEAYAAAIRIGRTSRHILQLLDLKLNSVHT